MRSVSVASDGSMMIAANNKVSDDKVKARHHWIDMGKKKGNVYVWRMTNTSSDCAEIAPVTKFSAHNDYILRCVLSPDTKYVIHTHSHTMLGIETIWILLDYWQLVQRIKQSRYGILSKTLSCK